MSTSRFTVADLEQAAVALKNAEARRDNYDGNNPNKYVTQVGEARRKVREITRALKLNGDLPMTDHERLEAELDALYPNASSGQIVEHDGGRYERRFRPARMSLSGKTVLEWDRSWTKL